MSEQNFSPYDSPQRPGGERHPQGHRRKKTKKSGSSAAKTVGKVILTLLLVAITTGALMCCFGAVYIKTVILPIAQEFTLDNINLGENSVMYYKDKETGEYKELKQVLATVSSTWVDYDEIPQYMKDAAVAIEDKRFWTHSGVDWKRTAMAVVSMFTGGDIQGGSTITQQLIKNLTEENETTVKRKVTEIFRALEFSKKYSKEETLNWYLNIIPLGSGCEGVGAAAYEYFGKPVSQLSLAECASLISITNNPSLYGPYSTAQVRNEKTGEMWDAKRWNKYRQENVLYQMLDQKLITQEEYDAAVAEELHFVSAPGEQETDIYSWYEEQVITDVRNDLVEKLGIAGGVADQMLASGGLRIYTCVDPELQALAEQVYSDRANLNYTSPTGQQLQSAITVIDNATGDVAAIVGRVGEKTGNRWSNYATSQRQPGSSIKPLSVYTPALEMGLITPASVLDDYPHEVLGGKAWPVNVDGKYRGMVTVEEAVINSYNTIAVRIIADLVTPQASFDFMQNKFHIELVQAKEINGQVKSDMAVAPLAMGGLTYGVSTRDMAEAFASFPNNGVYQYSRTYSKVTQLVDNQEKVLLDNEHQQEAIMKESTAYYINSMLKGVVTSGSGRQARFNGMTIAGKTGTTDSKYDRWFVGYTPYYTAAVWTGYDERNERINTGSTNPAITMWRLVMEQAHQGLENKSFSTPNGLVRIQYCKDSGLLATEACKLDPRGSRVAEGYVMKTDAPVDVCPYHSMQEGSNSLVNLCLDSPILNAAGEETGMYHIAGPYCPQESLKQVCLLNYDRETIGSAVAADQFSLYSVISSYGPCAVHVSAPVDDPEVEDPSHPDGPAPVPGGDPDPEDPGDSGGHQGPNDNTLINPETGRPYGY